MAKIKDINERNAKLSESLGCYEKSCIMSRSNCDGLAEETKNLSDEMQTLQNENSDLKKLINLNEHSEKVLKNPDSLMAEVF